MANAAFKNYLRNQLLKYILVYLYTLGVLFNTTGKKKSPQKA